ncbi:MAG: enterochelin esterase-like enzyme [Maribacter sp.]|jgi:enterochelin esterase-like enzyme|tara:strand:- start:378 stop:1187 length:810 start_codon:yes stop_codon:yes gene_type:complete
MDYQIDFISAKGSFFSKKLNRKVAFRFVAPGNYRKSEAPFPVLLMNDGQDYQAMKLEKTLTEAFTNTSITPFCYVGISCNDNRINEYGTSSTPDFKNRGNKAANYSKFIIEEFIPFLKSEFKLSKKQADWVFCGMSLGGVSAFDIMYNHPTHFNKVGVFSGSFWWRKKAYIKGDKLDRSRIVLDLIKNRGYAASQKFWFQCGSADETADRNHNGVIDAIDDTMDVIKELKGKGYSYPGDITYLEVDGGKHDLHTWGNVFPDFLKWAFKG